MAGWKETLIDILKLTDEVKGLSKDVDRLEEKFNSVDRRVVRLETMVEIAQNQNRVKAD